MKASVILATKDRGPAIGDTLDALLHLDFPAAEHEILLVDNCSSPHNRAHLQAFVTAHPDRTRYLREQKLGLSNARNCGIRHSRGNIIAFLDDDAIAPPHWLTNIVKAFNADAQVYAVGGKVVAKFTTSPPEWIDLRLGGYIGNFDHGDLPKRLSYNDYPRGVNMAFRREAFERCGYFLDAFGRKGTSLMSYEDIEMCYRIDRAGYTVLYTPHAEIHHLIRGDRLNEAWFRKRFYWQGRSEGLFELLHFGRTHVLKALSRHIALSVFDVDPYDQFYHRGFVTAIFLNFFRRKYE